MSEQTPSPTPPEHGQTIFVQLPNSDDGDDIHLPEIAAALRTAAVKIILIVSVVTLGAIGLSFLVTPVYRGEVAVAPVEYGNSASGLGSLAGSFGGIAALAGVDLGGNAAGKEALAVLRSRAFVERFLTDSELLPVLFEDVWDPGRDDWISEDDKPTTNEAVTYFQEEVLQISEQPDANLILIRVHWHDRELAALWANEIVAAINLHIRNSKIIEAEKSIAFLEQEQTASSIVEVKQGIYSLIQQQIEAIMFANVKEEYAFKVIDPAVVPDSDDNVMPNRLVWGSLAFFLALLLSVAYIVFREVFNREIGTDDSKGNR